MKETLICNVRIRNKNYILGMPITQSAYLKIIFVPNAALLINTPHTLTTKKIKSGAGFLLVKWWIILKKYHTSVNFPKPSFHNDVRVCWFALRFICLTDT